MPFSKLVLRALDNRYAANPAIAPSHGVIWRAHVSEIVALYKKWGTGETEPMALLVYDTMWGSTESYGPQGLGRSYGRRDQGEIVSNGGGFDKSEMVAELLTARGILIGACRR